MNERLAEINPGGSAQPLFISMYPVDGMQSDAHGQSDLKALPHHITSAPREYTERAYHFHKISDSTTASSESSPTTTASTVDDSSATDPSPGSSPESPPPATFAYGMLRPRTADASASPFFELQKQPPPRKGRNLKNLAVNTSRTPGRAPATLKLSMQPQREPDLSTIASPGFVKPPSPPRRKPANLGLTLLTPINNKAAPQEIRLAAPPTPAFSRPGMLRHFQSSPSLSIFPALGSETGRQPQAPLLRNDLDSILSPVLSPIVPTNDLASRDEEEEEEQNFDIPLSREEKPEAYPDGPICIYEPGIDLYAEPTAEQCRRYDVILNVASEVRNPFVKRPETEVAEPEIRIDGGGGIQFAPRRLLAAEATAVESSANASPTTPRATPMTTQFPEECADRSNPTELEYIHIPWEHNTDIVPDLLRLVKLIDDYVNQGKRVLVHCQCGVSRSASLVVAYGLYKDPTLSVQEAYDWVKRKSKWIGPNMNLIMQLQEFRTSLTRGGVLSGNRGLSPITPSSAYGEWHRALNGDESNVGRDEAPSSGLLVALPRESSTAVSPGPSSAPSGVAWPNEQTLPPVQMQRARAISAAKSTTVQPTASALVDPAGHIVPVLKVVKGLNGDRPDATLHASDQDCATPTEPLASPRATEFAMAPLQPSQAVTAADDFGIMSPTSMAFPTTFDRSALLASLGMGSVHEDTSSRRRSLSLRSRVQPPGSQAGKGLQPRVLPRLRGKISSPSLREQQQLQSMQAEIEARLHSQQQQQQQQQPQQACDESGASLMMDGTLMSPRATSFTRNPFALVVDGPTATTSHTVPQTSETVTADPRSPAQPGANPITRNIVDVL